MSVIKVRSRVKTARSFIYFKWLMIHLPFWGETFIFSCFYLISCKCEVGSPCEVIFPQSDFPRPRVTSWFKWRSFLSSVLPRTHSGHIVGTPVSSSGSLLPSHCVRGTDSANECSIAALYRRCRPHSSLSWRKQACLSGAPSPALATCSLPCPGLPSSLYNRCYLLSYP